MSCEKLSDMTLHNLLSILFLSLIFDFHTIHFDVLERIGEVWQWLKNKNYTPSPRQQIANPKMAKTGECLSPNYTNISEILWKRQICNKSLYQIVENATHVRGKSPYRPLYWVSPPPPPSPVTLLKEVCQKNKYTWICKSFCFCAFLVMSLDTLSKIRDKEVKAKV